MFSQTGSLLVFIFTITVNFSSGQSNGTIYIGSTSTKEFYMTEISVEDFLWANYICPHGYGLSAASIEFDEEMNVIDNYFIKNYGEIAHSVKLWTSGSRALAGSCPTQWSNGVTIQESITSPWQPGSGGNPSHMWYKCVTVQRTCFSWSMGSPCAWKGGHRFATQLIWEDCRSKNRILCQRKLTN